MRVSQNARFDDEYVKSKKDGQGSRSTRYAPMRIERDEESDRMSFVIYYQQAWEFAQSHWNIGARLRRADRAETPADIILHHMLCANDPKAVDHWHVRRSEASPLIRALLVSLQAAID